MSSPQYSGDYLFTTSDDSDDNSPPPVYPIIPCAGDSDEDLFAEVQAEVDAEVDAATAQAQYHAQLEQDRASFQAAVAVQMAADEEAEQQHDDEEAEQQQQHDDAIHQPVNVEDEKALDDALHQPPEIHEISESDPDDNEFANEFDVTFADHVTNNNMVTIPAWFVRKHHIKRYRSCTLTRGDVQHVMTLHTYVDHRISYDVQDHVTMTEDFRGFKQQHGIITNQICTFLLDRQAQRQGHGIQFRVFVNPLF